MKNIDLQRSPFQKNRLKKSLSQRKHIKIQAEQKKGEVSKKEISFKIQFQVPEVNSMVSQFEKQISAPIAYHIDVANARNTPKCMAHNNVLSLYCLNDSKPLCVSCMYLSSHHKPHKVIPLLKCEGELKDNIRVGRSIIKKNIEQLQSSIKINQQSLRKVEDEYPLILERLHNFYLSFHQVLVNKKNEQLSQLSENWSRLRYTYNLRVKQLSRMKQYISYQLEKLNLDIQGENLLYNRNIIGTLSRIEGMIKKQIANSEEGRFKQDFHRFDLIKQNVQNELVFFNLFQMDAHKKAINYISTKFSPKSFARYQKQNSFKSDMSGILDKNSNSEVSVIENVKSLKNSNPKNRHSKSDLLSKQQLSDQLKKRSQKQTKKKHFEFHNSIVMKSQRQLMRRKMTEPKSPQKQKKSPKK